MATDHVSELVSQIRGLPAKEQIQLLEELRQLIPENGKHTLHSMLELKGLGAELWSGIDAQDYVRRERSSWNG